MFVCKTCSKTPFAAFFGFGETEDDDKSIEQKEEKDLKDTEKSDEGEPSPKNVVELQSPQPEEMAGPRNAEEIGYLAKTWDTYVHERVKQLWKNRDVRIDILQRIARGCRKKDDPILGNDIECVKWIGDYENGFPVIYLSKPDDAKENTTYVNRMLVFMFADQESYEKIDVNKYTAFPMGCGNQWCINLTHIMLN